MLPIDDDAEMELREAAEWYEERVSGLGVAFLEHVIDGFEKIRKHPRRYARYMILRKREVRRLLLDRFPYAIVYEISETGSLTVLAIAHTSRRPGYWKKRGPNSK